LLFVPFHCACLIQGALVNILESLTTSSVFEGASYLRSASYFRKYGRNLCKVVYGIVFWKQYLSHESECDRMRKI